MTKEMDQLYRQIIFEPIDIKYLKPQEKRRSQETVMILDHKRAMKNPRKEWCSMENELESGCQGKIPRVSWHNWSIFLNNYN